MNTAQIQYIPISKLEKSDLNMRKSAASKADNDRLKASIKAHGIKQNLIVFPTSKTKFGVVAGGRRFTQALELVSEKHLKKSDTIPCLVASTEKEAIELSIVENTHRASASPVDEFEAYQDLKDTGATIKEIASNFGVSQTHVKQRLKLASTAPEIRQKIRDKKISLECGMAFTIESNHEKQLTALKALKAQSQTITPHQIRRLLTETSYHKDHKVAQFIDLKEYKNRGGTVTADMFENNTYLDCADIANEIALERLASIAKEMADGWLWHEIYINLPDHNYIWNMTSISGDADPELIKKEEELEDKIDILDDKKWDEEGLTKAEEKELEALESELEQVRERIEETRSFDPEEMKLSGFVVTIGDNGEPIFHMGRVRTADRPALQALHNGNEQESKSNQAGTTSSTKTTEDTGYSQALQSDLLETRRVITQAHLAARPELAIDLLHFNICRAILDHESWSTDIDVRSNHTFHDVKHPSVTECLAYESITSIAGTINRDWMQQESEKERFIAFQQLTPEEKLNLVAYCTAMTLNVERPDKEHKSALSEAVNQMDIQWETQWIPTKDNFLGRISKPNLIQTAKPFMPAEWADHAEKSKKGDLAEELENVFAGNDDRLSAEQQAQANSWLPAGII